MQTPGNADNGRTVEALEYQYTGPSQGWLGVAGEVMGLMSSMITESGQKVAAVNEGEQLVNYKSLTNEIQGSPRKQQRRVEARFILVKHLLYLRE